MKNQNKKHISLVVALAALMGLAGTAIALPNGVMYGPHNLGTTGSGNFAGGTETEICIYCHTPHNAEAGQKFLWVRQGQTASFALYTASPTLNFTKAGAQLSDVSKMCMSCHDGATALNSMANPRPGMVSNRLGDVWDPSFTGEWGPNIGEWGVDSGGSGGNLTNDHPVSFNYDQSYAAESAAGTLYPINDAKAKGLVFWGPGQNMVECVTCHDPHVNYGSWYSREPGRQHSLGTFDRSLAPFLRRSNASSGLCFSCHNK